MIQKRVSEGWTYQDIQETYGVGSHRIAAVAKNRPRGTPGRPRKFGDDIIEFIETNFLCNARISDFQMKSMVEETFQRTISRPQVCRIRKRTQNQIQEAYHSAATEPRTEDAASTVC